MSAKPSRKADLVRFELDGLPAAPPLSPDVKALSEDEIMRRAALDPDQGDLPADFWDKAKIVEPDGTEQITLRLPRRVLGHFKATGKGYQTRISAVLASYVDSVKKQNTR